MLGTHFTTHLVHFVYFLYTFVATLGLSIKYILFAFNYILMVMLT
jgi:hypothetical protein